VAAVFVTADQVQAAFAAHASAVVKLAHGLVVVQTPLGQAAPAGQSAPMAIQVQERLVSAVQSAEVVWLAQASFTETAGICVVGAFGVVLRDCD
jgi:hypothetical protein